MDSTAKLLVRELLRCPRCKSGIAAVQAGAPARAFVCQDPDCEMSQAGFPALDGIPVLVDFDNSVLSREEVQLTGGSSYTERSTGLLQKVHGFFWQSASPTAANADRFIAEAKGLDPHPSILVIGGGTIGSDAETLYRDPDLTLIGTDIYKSDRTLIIADGHQLPLASGAIHGVWIQAVLEHVLTPEQVVAEIHRVLVPNGVVYAETPFMQQVHEGPYDFTRFTPSGHRWLFRHFDEIDGGITRGPAIVMLWSIRYFVGSLFGSYKVGTMAATGLFWLRHFERLSRPSYAADGASACYFLGRRSERAMKPKDIIAYYKGAQR
ncbi:class I SAM-dependent methyltransferase [Mesorhizobium sp. M1423]|uniref:methyltransferase domain-containing protein n=1 Tax=Mesorhizobium sp. M1423 TaxID=2957101 RepID=UPI003336DA97